MKKILPILLLFISIKTTAFQKDSLKWSEKMAVSIMKRNPKVWQIDNVDKLKWDYKPSFVLFAFEKLYKKTNNEAYNNYIKDYLNTFIDSTGTIDHFEVKEFNLDGLTSGKFLFDLYQNTHKQQYLRALQILRSQLDKQPRTPSGGFWHKNVYPNQMWLDGIYMGTPFYTRYTVTFENGKNLDDIVKQFELIHDNDFDPISKLPYHAWDESKAIAWANPTTGTSPTIWARGVGFYTMALVDVLDYFPKTHPKYKELLTYLKEISSTVVKNQDKSGLWFQIMDKPTYEGNYLETSGTGMIAYSLAKAVNKGYLPKKYKKNANKAFDGLLTFTKTDASGEVHLSQISQGIGLGGNPFRDGSNKYYADAKKFTDNSMGVGAFILAALELGR